MIKRHLHYIFLVITFLIIHLSVNITIYHFLWFSINIFSFCLFVKKKRLNTNLTHFQPMFHFYTPWKHHKTFRFPDVFRGYRIGTLVKNGLMTLIWNAELLKRFMTVSLSFCLDFLVMYKNGLISKVRLISKLMTSQSG